MFFFGKTVPTFALLVQADAKMQADYRALETRAAQKLLPAHTDTQPGGEMYEAHAIHRGVCEEQEHARTTRQTAMLRIVAEGLKRQGRVSQSSRGVCSYRGVKNSACAVGLLIPDKSYTMEIEGGTIFSLQRYVFRGWRAEDAEEVMQEQRSLVLWELLGAEGVKAEDLPFLEDLQGAHDNVALEDGRRPATFWPYMRRMLSNIADDYGLDRSVIPE